MKSKSFGGGITLHNAILQGLANAAKHGLTKPDDIGFCVLAAIDAAGLKVIRKSAVDEAGKGDRRWS